MSWTISLWTSSSVWEGIEYTAEALVIAGASAEVLTDFEYVLRGDEQKELRHELSKIAAITLVIGLALGLGALVRTNAIFSGEIESSYRAARKASEQAEHSSDDAVKARGQAADAITASAKANERASLNEREAAGERLARIRLAESISWRTPDRALIPRLASTLLPFSGQTYTIVIDLTDPERLNIDSWIHMLLSSAKWKFETALSTSELRLTASNIVLWISPSASSKVLIAVSYLKAALEEAGLSTNVLQIGWGPKPDAAPPEEIRVVVFRRGPKMNISAHVISFEGSSVRMFLGEGPPGQQ